MQSGAENEAQLAFRLRGTFWRGLVFIDLWLASLTLSLPPQDLVLCSPSSPGHWAGALAGWCSGPVGLPLGPGLGFWAQPHSSGGSTGPGLGLAQGKRDRILHT